MKKVKSNRIKSTIAGFDIESWPSTFVLYDICRKYYRDASSAFEWEIFDTVIKHNNRL